MSQRFCTCFYRHSHAPQRSAILIWHEKLFAFSGVLHRQLSFGWPRTATSEDCSSEAFRKFPKNLIRRAGAKMNLIHSLICRMLDQSSLKAHNWKFSMHFSLRYGHKTGALWMGLNEDDWEWCDFLRQFFQHWGWFQFPLARKQTELSCLGNRDAFRSRGTSTLREGHLMVGNVVYRFDKTLTDGLLTSVA